MKTLVIVISITLMLTLRRTHSDIQIDHAWSSAINEIDHLWHFAIDSAGVSFRYALCESQFHCFKSSNHVIRDIPNWWRSRQSLA